MPIVACSLVPAQRAVMHSHRVHPHVCAFLLTLALSVSLMEAERSGTTVTSRKPGVCVPITLSERAVIFDRGRLLG